MNPALSYIYARLSEPSTWRGLVALVTAAGVALSPHQVDKIVAAGLALMGLVGAFMPDRFKTAVIILAVLSAMTGTASAQSPILPWRAQIHQRLQKLESSRKPPPRPPRSRRPHPSKHRHRSQSTSTCQVPAVSAEWPSTQVSRRKTNDSNRFWDEKLPAMCPATFRMLLSPSHRRDEPSCEARNRHGRKRIGLRGRMRRGLARAMGRMAGSVRRGLNRTGHGLS